MKSWKRVVAVVASVVLTAGLALAERHTFRTDSLEVLNLIGEIRIQQGSGSSFEVEVEVGGRDGDRIGIDRTEDRLTVRYPDEGAFVYPALGGRDSSTMSVDSDDGWLARIFGGKRDRVKVRGSGSGLEAWADVTVHVPRGARLELHHGVGEISVADADGELELETQAGNVKARNTGGRLSVATGSGNVELDGNHGEQIEVATGSGDVRVRSARCEKLDVATGSGDVDLDAVGGEDVNVATGSGDIDGQQLDAVDLSLATGSGDVTVDLSRAGAGELGVGTGSGNIKLSMPPGTSAKVHAETGSGRVRVQVPDVIYELQEEDEVEFVVGAGTTRVELGTGSGNISIDG